MMQYMFLEYAVGGELFDRIEPDVGMPAEQARRFFTDILNGLVGLIKSLILLEHLELGLFKTSFVLVLLQ